MNIEIEVDGGVDSGADSGAGADAGVDAKAGAETNTKISFELNSTTGRVTPARFVASPNCDSRPGDPTPETAQIDVLVIHAISLPPRCYGGEYIEQFFTNRLVVEAHPYFAEIRDARVSSHFLIARDGRLVQFVPTHKRAWHAGESNFRGREKVNDFSLGIELEGCDEEPFETAQYTVLATLTGLLMRHYPAITPAHITGHNQIAPHRKTDPGPHFDWARLRKGIQ